MKILKFSIVLLCSIFWMTATAQSLVALKNLSPADGKAFTDKESKALIPFSWTLIAPKPREAVTYKLRIWQLLEGQNAAVAMKSNKPIATQEVVDANQATVSNLAINGCKLPYLCSFVWQVQAVNKERTVLGNSEATGFRLTSSECDVSLKIDSVLCTGKQDAQGNPIYKFYITLNNSGTHNLQLNNTLNITTNPYAVANTYVPKYILQTNALAFLPIINFPSIVPVGTTSFNTDVSMAATATTAFIRLTLYDATSIASCNPIDSIRLPNCACNPCKNKVTSFGKDSTYFQNGGLISATSTVSHGPTQVIKVSAEIVDVERLGEAGCLQCTKESKEFGNYTSGTLNGNAGSIVNGGKGYGKEIQWSFSTPTTISNYSYDFQMAFPPLTSVSCCKDSIKYCIRWRFMDKNCVTCDTLICKVVVREYKKPDPFQPRITTLTYSEQIEKMGQPYFSWYQQESNELPANFNAQVQELYQRRQVDRNEEVSLEVFTQNAQQTFEAIRNLRATSSDAVWNVISNNPLNTPCGNGDFENGIVGFSDWSGAYGNISSSTNNPSLGTYTAGFSPSTVGLNLLISTFANNHSVVSYGNDPTLGAALKTTPQSTNLFSFRIGNSAVGKGSELISKKFTVTGNGIIKFMYALMMNGTHSTTDNPSFWVKVYDNTGTPITNTVYLDPLNSAPIDKVVSSSTDPFFQHTGSINFKDWTCAKIDLRAYINQTVSVALISTDCDQGAHFGYAYIDNWCAGCENPASGIVNIKPIADSCIKSTSRVCVDYTLPHIGTTVGSGTITLNFYQSGVLVPAATMTSPVLSTTVNGTYCFNIDPSKLPCKAGVQGYDVVATGNFTINSTAITVNSPDPVGSPIVGIKPGLNNDLVCCSTLAEDCCANFRKTVTTTYSIVGNTSAGFNTIKFVPTFTVGPKLIKKVVISILNFEINSSNKECLTCESNPTKYGSMSVPQSFLGGGKDPIEGMTYPTKPPVLACFPVPCPTWNAGYLTHEVTWGSNSGPGYNLMDGIGDQTTTFFVHLPKKSTLVCCDDTIKVCVKYSFTDIDCVTCDTIICYKIINRQNPALPFRTGFLNHQNKPFDYYAPLLDAQNSLNNWDNWALLPKNVDATLPKNTLFTERNVFVASRFRKKNMGS